ncbi:MAG: head GIN domain-containing protein [Bacteroidota bacterium]
MKKLLIISFLAVTIFGSAQVTKDVVNFTKITSFDKINVTLVSTTGEPKVVLTGAGSEDVEIIQKDSELKIRMPLGKLLKGDNITATVYYRKDVYEFEANEGSRISSNDEFHGMNLNFIAKEGSSIKLNVSAQKINVKSFNGSVINLSGKAQNIDVVINSGGIVEARDCMTSQAVVSVNAGGSADVTASDLVDAKTRAGGNITIYGNPKLVNQKTVLGGNITINKR